MKQVERVLMLRMLILLVALGCGAGMATGEERVAPLSDPPSGAPEQRVSRPDFKNRLRTGVAEIRQEQQAAGNRLLVRFGIPVVLAVAAVGAGGAVWRSRLLKHSGKRGQALRKEGAVRTLFGGTVLLFLGTVAGLAKWGIYRSEEVQFLFLLSLGALALLALLSGTASWVLRSVKNRES